MSDTPVSSSAPVHATRRGFPVQGGTLLINGRTLHEVAQTVGRTPFYAVDRSALHARVAELFICTMR